MLPWLAPVLLGIVIARTGPGVPAWHPKTMLPKAVAWAGRHSLLVYVAHQPLLLGVLFLAGLARPPAAIDTAKDFSHQCRAECGAAGAGVEGCRAACECVRLKLGPVLGTSTADQPKPFPAPTPEELRDAGSACLQASPVGPPPASTSRESP